MWDVAVNELNGQACEAAAASLCVGDRPAQAPQCSQSLPVSPSLSHNRELAGPAHLHSLSCLCFHSKTTFVHLTLNLLEKLSLLEKEPHSSPKLRSPAGWGKCTSHK